MLKSLKNARRRPTKRRNREKTLVVGRRNAENAEKCPSSADETQKNAKNNLSYPYDEQKSRKTTFRTPTMSRKREKPRFVGVQSIKNGKNSLS